MSGPRRGDPASLQLAASAMPPRRRSAGPPTSPTAHPRRDPLGPDLPPGVHRSCSRRATSTIVPRLQQSGWSTRVVDLVGAADKAAVLERLAIALGFPGWVGRNWDALDDALRDLAWWPSGALGRVIVIRGAGRASTATARDRGMLRSVLETAASRWAETATPLVVLLRR